LRTIEEIKAAIEARVPGAKVEIIANPSPSAQHSLLIAHEHAVAVATFLRDDKDLAFDYLSNVTGVDWPGPKNAEGAAIPGYLEAVYHLYSMAKGYGPLIIRLRTANRTDQVELPSLTPVWRAADFQEREIFDLFGVIFKGHPDLRRLLMWRNYKDHPMRKDYVDPDDYEYEPTAHDAVLARAEAHKSREQGSGNRDQERTAG
jgi:NADH-quinone oxidoreductase subunit C